MLRDGKENTATPTPNTIVVVPAMQTSYYTSMSEEPFIEKNINWLRLRDVTLSYELRSASARNASVFVTGDGRLPVDQLHRPRSDRERQRRGGRRLRRRRHRLRRLPDPARNQLRLQM